MTVTYIFPVYYCILHLIRNSLCQTDINTITTTTTQGVVRGRVIELQNRFFGVYLGIPYAQPPVGNLRFDAPQPPSSYAGGQFDASGTQFASSCIQPGNDTQAEDCLYLNIYTPATTTQNGIRYPVLFWIHGGGFVSGNGNQDVIGSLYNIVMRDVVLVAINYRLGYLGFWNTESSVAPGNYGLLDQIQALRWTRENIINFGGDPNKITIFGESAGGTSVSYLTLSPLARGLFSQGIMMSGSAFTVKAPNPSRQIAAKVNCARTQGFNQISAAMYQNINPWMTNNSVQRQDTSADTTMLQCMRQVPVSQLKERFSDLGAGPNPRVDGALFPTAFGYLANQRPAMRLMIGTTKDEYGELAKEPGDRPFAYNKTVMETLANAYYSDTSCPVNVQSLKAIARCKYVAVADMTPHDEGPDSLYWFNQKVKFLSSIEFWIPAYVDAMAALRRGSNVYLYSFDYDKSDGAWSGAPHASELGYLFPPVAALADALPSSTSPTEALQALFEILPGGQNDRNVINAMGEFFTNFARDGVPRLSNPAVQWQQLSPMYGNYMSISAQPQMLNGYHSDDIATGFLIDQTSNYTCFSRFDY